MQPQKWKISNVIAQFIHLLTFALTSAPFIAHAPCTNSKLARQYTKDDCKGADNRSWATYRNLLDIECTKCGKNSGKYIRDEEKFGQHIIPCNKNLGLLAYLVSNNTRHRYLCFNMGKNKHIGFFYIYVCWAQGWWKVRVFWHPAHFIGFNLFSFFLCENHNHATHQGYMQIATQEE